MQIDEELRLRWLDLSDFSAESLYELLRFRQAIFVVEQASPYTDLDGLDRGARHLLARTGNELVGCLRLIPFRDEHSIAIGRVAVAASWRGRGLARLLMMEALDRGRHDFPGCAITLSAQTYLVPFYASLGFRATSAPYDDFGVPHTDMMLRERNDR